MIKLTAEITKIKEQIENASVQVTENEMRSLTEEQTPQTPHIAKADPSNLPDPTQNPEQTHTHLLYTNRDPACAPL